MKKFCYYQLRLSRPTGIWSTFSSIANKIDGNDVDSGVDGEDNDGPEITPDMMSYYGVVVSSSGENNAKGVGRFYLQKLLDRSEIRSSLVYDACLPMEENKRLYAYTILGMKDGNPTVLKSGQHWVNAQSADEAYDAGYPYSSEALKGRSSNGCFNDWVFVDFRDR
jgi:hypothetical protein